VHPFIKPGTIRIVSGFLFGHSSTVHHSMQNNLLHGGLQLNAQEKSDLIAFLHTLTDATLVDDQRFASPF
jgi:hypothetical protein